ncbi:hypothetical protein NMK54_11630 [Nocardia otitidiscaviarum]|uniref:hypothetical protein n=1 Tax=Nocardia otitidiscaviarum TaxID=1823 RepID=UPI0020CF2F82|nr:hypothetical protein [Nocardia otitidiscaviarum]MCP9620803.1 hypothetical protein [Nocardia otitidiscaviarum]
MEAELAKRAVAHGWPDQRWTLARITTVIGGPSGGRTQRGRDRRLGEGYVAAGKTTAAALDARLVFEDETGFTGDVADRPHLVPAWPYSDRHRAR